MNHEAASPFHGALTDVNLWSRVLSVEELEAWARCSQLTSGGGEDSLVSWETAVVSVRGVREGRVERASTCYREESSLLLSRTERTFDGAVQHCSALGVSIATAGSEEELREMLRVFSGECPAPGNLLYTGHSDREEEGRWRDVTTNTTANWWVWRTGEPSNEAGEDCALADVGSGEISDGQCSVLTCPLCQLKNNPVPRLYKLRRAQVSIRADNIYN